MSDSNPRIVEDVSEVRAALRGDPVGCAFMLADLDQPLDEYCTWFAAGPIGHPKGVLLLYAGLRTPAIITYGQSGAMDEIVERFAGQLPDLALLQMQPHHLAAIDRRFKSEFLRPMLRLGLAAQDFVPPRAVPFDVLTLSHRDTGDIIELQQHYLDSFFEPAQLDLGHYYGVRIDGRLVSMAGVHALSKSSSVAVLGNIVTHPEHRGRGYSTACCGRLCEGLIQQGFDALALNVERRNRSAVRVYEKLGFRYHDTFIEGRVKRMPDHSRSLTAEATGPDEPLCP